MREFESKVFSCSEITQHLEEGAGGTGTQAALVAMVTWQREPSLAGGRKTTFSENRCPGSYARAAFTHVILSRCYHSTMKRTLRAPLFTWRM